MLGGGLGRTGDFGDALEFESVIYLNLCLLKKKESDGNILIKWEKAIHDHQFHPRSRQTGIMVEFLQSRIV